jgi:SAM-dependent methyltransferase
MKQDWTDGYVSDIEYTHGYYKELSPGALAFAALLKGVDVDLSVMAAPRYLELGFGQGVSLALHAATLPGQYAGTDFNPTQTKHCQQLMAAATVQARVWDHGFTELADLADLGTFDVIVFHGIWSWVNAENRAAMLRIVREHLAPGGLMYCSYNSSPGWDAGKPLRDLMVLHRQFLGNPQSNTVQQIETSVQFAQQVVAVDTGFFKVNPSAAKRLDGIAEHNKHYLAHEYFNENWMLMGCAEVAKIFGDAKLDYVAQSSPIEDDDSLQVNAAGKAMLEQTQHPQMKEVLRDYLTNRQFRKDIFIKGRHLLSSQERMHQLNQFQFILLKLPSQIAMKLRVGAGELALKVEIYLPLIKALSANQYSPKTLQQLLQVPELKGVGLGGMLQALGIFLGAGHIQPILPRSDAQLKDAIAKSAALNAYLLDRVVFNEQISQLASPVAGCGVNLNSVHMLMLKAYQLKHKTPQAIAQYVFGVHESIGRRVMVGEAPNRKAVDTKEAHVAELERLAGVFITESLPLYLGHGLVNS